MTTPSRWELGDQVRHLRELATADRASREVPIRFRARPRVEGTVDVRRDGREREVWTGHRERFTRCKR